MDKATFTELFIKNVKDALRQARETFPVVVPEGFEVELHGAGASGDVMTADEAAQRLFIAEDRYYRVIDIGLKSVSSDRSRLFVRVSSHPPADFESTWNQPKGNGPFKVILPLRL